MSDIGCLKTNSGAAGGRTYNKARVSLFTAHHMRDTSEPFCENYVA